jgi:hypothetical protein
VRYALYLKNNTLRGGHIQDINLDTVSGTFSHDIVYVNMKYNSETGSNVPIINNINLNNISDTSCPQVLDLVGLSGDPIQNMLISNSNFTSITNTTNTISYANVTYENVTVNGSPVSSPSVAGAAATPSVSGATAVRPGQRRGWAINGNKQ